MFPPPLQRGLRRTRKLAESVPRIRVRCQRAKHSSTMKIQLLLPLLLAATSASAGWFVEDGSYQRRREEKVAVLSPPRLDALRKMIAERDAWQTDVVILGRLAAEKAAEIERIDKRFAGEYGIRADRNYTYDPSDLTVYLLSTDVRHGGSADSPVRLAHRVFPTDEEAQAFLSLMAAKQAATDARSVFLTTAAEKEALLRDVTDRMGREYKLDPVRSYRLEPVTRSVFVEYVTPPQPRDATPEELAARAEAAAEEERKAREEAEANAARLRAEAKRLAEEKTRLTAEEAEAERMRQEDLKRIERQLAELDAKEAARRKEAEQKRLEEERIAKQAAEKAAKEKARAEEFARREAEKAARVLAERREEKALAEKKAAEKAARELAAQEAARERKEREEAEKKAREEAIQAEEAALARHVAKVKSVRTSKLDRAVRALEMAERNEREAGERFEEARRFYKEARSAGLLSEERISRLRRDADAAEEALDAAKTARKEAGRARDEAQDRLDRAEKDATKAFDDNLRAKGGKPVRPSASGGFFSWF